MVVDTILILAGGDGDRFTPLSHKMTYKFNGKPLIAHVIEGVKQYGTEVVVVSNEVNKTMLENLLADYSVQFTVQKSDKGGMADAVLASRDYIKGSLLILNANDLFDFKTIPSLIKAVQESHAQFGFIAKKINTYFPGGYVQFEGKKPVAIVEKPGEGKEPSQFVRLVSDYYPDGGIFVDSLSALPSSEDQYETAMTAVMKSKIATCITYEGDWSTLKYGWHVLDLQKYAFSHLLTASVNRGQNIHPTAQIDGLVHIGNNSKVGAFVKISGPCFIGDNVIVGDHSLIRESTLCNNVVVGAGSEVARSYLNEGVILHRNYVGDSILGNNTTMGAGAVTANFRFDAKTIKTPIKNTMIETNREKLGLITGNNVKIGVNACTFPGVKLAVGSVVLPGEVVKKDK